MLQVDYEISRKERDGEWRVFHPPLKEIQSNAIYLEAPNAKGKSSLLNILAIGMYGHELKESDSRISPTLKSNIDYMMQREDQRFTFTIKFSSKDGKIQLISSKESPDCNDITIREVTNGQEKILPFQIFKDLYYLVYDIPEDPLNRLKEIIVEVGHQQSRYKNKVSDFKRYLEEIKEQLASSRDENKIREFKIAIEENTAKMEDLEVEIDEINTEIQVVKLYYALRGFRNNAKLALSFGDSLSRKEEKLKKAERVEKRHSNAYFNKKESVENLIDLINQLISKLTVNLENIFIESKDMRSRIKKIQQIDLLQTIDTHKLDFVVKKGIKEELDYFNREINTYIDKREIKEAGRKGNFFKEILKTLETYQGIDISIPGTGRSIEELIGLIQLEYDKNKGKVAIYNKLNECKEISSQISKKLDKLPDELSSLKILFEQQKDTSEKAPNLYNTIDRDIDELSHEFGKVFEKTNKYSKIAEEYGFDVHGMGDAGIEKEIQQIISENKQYLTIFQQDEEKISKTLERRNKVVTKKNEEAKRLQEMISQLSQRVSEFESRQKHKYDAYTSEIDDIGNLADSLEYDLISYGKILNKINYGEALKTPEEIKYNDQISRYLALKIPEFPYIDDFIRPEKIDFTCMKIYTDTGREIDMRDISTGQAMSMYIQAILNRPSDDDRRLIVIFDEASTMDSNSFQPIKKTLERLVNENKLIFAVFARAIDGEMKLTKIV